MSERLSEVLDPESLVLTYLENPRPDLKDMIMVQYASLVERTARRFSGIEPQEDLVQVGFIGLLNALTKFDAKAGVRFNTYATHLVAGEIKHYLRDKTQTIRQPAWLQELRHRVNKAASAIQARKGEAPTEHEIASELGISENAVREVFQTQEMLKVGSLDTSQGDEDGSEVDSLDSGEFCPEQLSVEDRVVLQCAIKQLRDLERQVLVLFHFESLNQTEIAGKLGISCNYVSHILRQSLTKLRRILTSEDEKDRLLRRQTQTLGENVLDFVSGVYSERYFRNRLVEELHRASSCGGATGLIMIDFQGLDGLRAFYGEVSVSDFLADVGEHLRNVVRRLDITCKFGATGFAVIMPGSGSTVGMACQRLQQKTEQFLASRRAPTGSIGLKVGAACAPEDGRSASDLIASALAAIDGVKPVVHLRAAA